ncbi:MAG: hypothetical protein JWN03_4344 [Nocardia sp.]|nr:hypothetical protein [Nocardia sp.]
MCSARSPCASDTPSLDIANGDRIRSAASAVGSLDVLVNNADIALCDDPDDRSAIERQLVVNLPGCRVDSASTLSVEGSGSKSGQLGEVLWCQLVQTGDSE